ncbi:biliverdin-producing heme oxygenase [Pedobacter deserti]|uniref:biliverdin-producing heme oxygenase n=1 Tax=Pedobacter deserti TaxID=2817382 RepID=UPI00210D222E|nr:biliverdin-producing heme oxygenase [Pedobacter sp. SYSU D00382]
MLSTKIKEATRVAHQELEKKVVLKMKAIRSEADYAEMLKNFYAYFSEVERAIAPYITAEVLPDYAERRNSAYLKADIEELGGSLEQLPPATAPSITNVQGALGALYVMEGSIMGGPIIVQMLTKHGLSRGFSFFSGYGEATGEMWGRFVAVLNAHAQTAEHEELAVRKANETFERFGDVFDAVTVA